MSLPPCPPCPSGDAPSTAPSSGEPVYGDSLWGHSATPDPRPHRGHVLVWYHSKSSSLTCHTVIVHCATDRHIQGLPKGSSKVLQRVTLCHAPQLRTQHHMHRSPGLPAMREKERREPRAGMYTSVKSKCDLQQKRVPLPLTGQESFRQLINERSIKTLNHAVRFRIVRCGACFLNPQQLTQTS